MFGNPQKLIFDVSSGMTELLNLPSIENFSELQTMSKSVMRKTVGGFAMAISKASGSASKLVGLASLDKDFVEGRLKFRHDCQTKNMPKNIIDGSALGVRVLFESTWSGITGLQMMPSKGYKQNGCSGLFVGIGKGFVGVFAKPLSGVIDSLSITFEGISNIFR